MCSNIRTVPLLPTTCALNKSLLYNKAASISILLSGPIKKDRQVLGRCSNNLNVTVGHCSRLSMLD